MAVAGVFVAWLAIKNIVKINFMNMIVIVGTSHTIQTTEPKLKVYLESLCKKFSVCAIAEEMFEEALAERNCAESIPMQVAKKLQIEHKFCDPNWTIRTELGILQENQIRLNDVISKSHLPESQIAALVNTSHLARERYWLEQLRDLNRWPVLFICGANHVKSFCRVAEQQGLAVNVAVEDWE